MRPFALLFPAMALALAACPDPEQAQGTIFYGTFAMSAGQTADGCSIGGQPAFTSTVTLSADPADGGLPRFYMRVAGQGDREGTIRGAHFIIDGQPVAQTIEACICDGTQIQERVEGVLSYPSVDAGTELLVEGMLADGGFREDAPAPVNPDAGYLPQGFAGKLVDTLAIVNPTPECTCAAVDAGPCQVTYELNGVRQ